jgi:hypothetical protein
MSKDKSKKQYEKEMREINQMKTQDEISRKFDHLNKRLRANMYGDYTGDLTQTQMEKLKNLAIQKGKEIRKPRRRVREKTSIAIIKELAKEEGLQISSEAAKALRDKFEDVKRRVEHLDNKKIVKETSKITRHRKGKRITIKDVEFFEEMI